jgi:hypothetical protein
VLFAFCREPNNCVILNADTGKVITALPIGNGVDAGEFNPATMEAFSSQADGTLTVVKEDSPTSFHLEQTVATPAGAKTLTLDPKTNHIYLITAEYGPLPAAAAQEAPLPPGAPIWMRRRPPVIPHSFQILLVGQ